MKSKLSWRSGGRHCRFIQFGQRGFAEKPAGSRGSNCGRRVLAAFAIDCLCDTNLAVVMSRPCPCRCRSGNVRKAAAEVFD